MHQSAFELDQQTLHDLAITSDSAEEKSILKLFDKAATFGGGYKLREIFRNPLRDRQEIEQRIETIRYLQQTDTGFNAEKGSCDYIEFYLNRGNTPKSVSKIKAVERKVMYFFTGENDYYIITRGIAYTLKLLKALDEFTKTSDFDRLPALLQEFYRVIRETLEHPDFLFIATLFQSQKLSAVAVAKADHLFRYAGHKRLKVLLDIVYRLDVFMAVASQARILGFSLPVISKTDALVLRFRGLFHPFINNPVPNDIEFNHDKNIGFVTGANMAGKSTFLKSIGISVFLSQIGFPVPAAYMETSIFDGLITTINLADNILQGNSHFYMEVSRVKHIAKKMNGSPNMVVIFDELFRGTNVKDAFDASLSVISAFAKLRKGVFIISTHIIEVANELAAIENINFKFMETSFENGAPTFSYELKDGITEERLGMWIVKNEGILEIIEGIANGKDRSENDL